MKINDQGQDKCTHSSKIGAVQIYFIRWCSCPDFISRFTTTAHASFTAKIAQVVYPVMVLPSRLWGPSACGWLGFYRPQDGTKYSLFVVYWV